VQIVGLIIYISRSVARYNNENKNDTFIGKFNCNVQYLGRCRVNFTSLQPNPSYYYCNVRVSVVPAFMRHFREQSIKYRPCFLIPCDMFRISYHNLMTLLVICSCWDIGWLSHRATNRKVAVSIPDGIIVNFLST